MTKILGISAFYHDSAATIVVDGKIIAAAQEERFTRKKHDSDYPYNAIEFVLNFTDSKLSEIDAAVLNIRLRYLDWYIKKRNNNAEIYQQILSSKNIQFQSVCKNATSAWRNFPIRIKNRNYIYDQLYKKKLNVSLNYLPPNHKDVCYSHLKNKFKLPITETICSEIINLPCHPYISQNEIKKITKAIINLVK